MTVFHSRLFTLLTEFTYTDTSADGIVLASYRINNVNHTQKLRVMSEKDNKSDACLLRAENYLSELKQPLSQTLITREGDIRPYYHVLRLFNQNLKQEIVAFDITNLHDASFFFDMNNDCGVNHLPFVNVPNLLLR